MFAGAFFGSVHASADGGKTWERRDNGITVHDVYSLASNVVEGKVRVYAGTEPAHLFCSEDLGQHWSDSRRCVRYRALQVGRFQLPRTSRIPSSSPLIPVIPAPFTLASNKERC